MHEKILYSELEFNHNKSNVKLSLDYSKLRGLNIRIVEEKDELTTSIYIEKVSCDILENNEEAINYLNQIKAILLSCWDSFEFLVFYERSLHIQEKSNGVSTVITPEVFWAFFVYCKKKDFYLFQGDIVLTLDNYIGTVLCVYCNSLETMNFHVYIPELQSTKRYYNNDIKMALKDPNYVVSIPYKQLKLQNIEKLIIKED